MIIYTSTLTHSHQYKHYISHDIIYVIQEEIISCTASIQIQSLTGIFNQQINEHGIHHLYTGTLCIMALQSYSYCFHLELYVCMCHQNDYTVVMDLSNDIPILEGTSQVLLFAHIHTSYTPTFHFKGFDCSLLRR